MGGVPKEEYPYRNGPMRSSPQNNGELVPSSGSVSGPARTMQQGAVMMVYGLCKDKINAERLFNLFCLYGNVTRVSTIALCMNVVRASGKSSESFFSCVKKTSGLLHARRLRDVTTSVRDIFWDSWPYFFYKICVRVGQVKFLKSKEGCAMVQMGDAISVERAMSNFNNSKIN